MRDLRRATLVAASVSVLVSCVQVPLHDGPARVPLDRIVKLLKCDIVRTVRAKLREQNTQNLKDNKFAFLVDWAAKVHLTIIVDDTFSINPGATFIHPGAVTGTSFSVGTGAGITTEAIRQEDIEFFLSFRELGDEFSKLARRAKGVGLEKYDNCMPAGGLLLESDLGLKPIFDMALQPVADQILTRGKHPGLASAPAPSVLAASATLNNYLNTTLSNAFPPVTNLDIFLERNPKNKPKFDLIIPEQGLERAKKIATDIAEAEKIENDAQSIIKNIVTPLYDVASSSLSKKCLSDSPDKVPGITSDKYSAVVSASLVSVAKINVDAAKTPDDSSKALAKEKDAQKDTVMYAISMVNKMNACLKNPPPKDEVPLNDPISLISETINFYITSTGSVTPTWKLVRITAPLAPTFVSGTRKDTNTLIIAMGTPDIKDGQASPSAAMNQQILSSLLGQAVTNRP